MNDQKQISSTYFFVIVSLLPNNINFLGFCMLLIFENKINRLLLAVNMGYLVLGIYYCVLSIG